MDQEFCEMNISNLYDDLEAEEGQHLNDLKMTVLTNPLILNCIFSKLDINDLKTIRQVSSFWAGIGASALGDKSILYVYDMLPFFTDELKPPPFNVQLAKNIDIWASDDSGHYDVAKSVQLFQPINKVVESIHLNTEMELIPSFMDKMNQHAFSNLHSVCIFSLDRMNPYHIREKGDSPQLPALRLRSSIKNVELVTSSPGSEQYQHILQGLVTSSPNLENLIIVGNLYPDLSQASKLKSLKHCSYPNVDLVAFEAMLTSGRKTIEKLKLDYTHPHPIRSSPNEFCLPPMPNLVNLNVFSCDLYRIQDSLDEEHLPKLQSLSIFSRSPSYTVRDFLINLWKRHCGIVSLSMYTHTGPDVIKRAAELFPNVVKLNVGFFPIRFAEDELDEVTESYNAWRRLKNSEFSEIKNVSQNECLFKAVSTWKGLSRNQYFLRLRWLRRMWV